MGHVIIMSLPLTKTPNSCLSTSVSAGNLLQVTSAAALSYFRHPLLAGFFIVVSTRFTGALELEPGFYRNAPAGLNALHLSYRYSSGNILIDDSSVEVDDAKAHLHMAALGYAHYFGLFQKMARADALVPVAWGHFEGNVNGQFLTRDPHGLGDPLFRFTVNLAGAPALDRDAFQSYHQRTIWGLSLVISAPFGQYDADRLINLGSNRWGFRPETGLSQVWGNWCVEGAAGAWVYTPNHDYFHGSKLTQKPIGYMKGDVIYNFDNRLWLAANYGFASGGRTSVNGVEKADLQSNHRIGGNVSMPIGKRDRVILAYFKGLVTRVGANFQTVTLGYTHTW